MKKDADRLHIVKSSWRLCNEIFNSNTYEMKNQLYCRKSINKHQTLYWSKIGEELVSVYLLNVIVVIKNIMHGLENTWIMLLAQAQEMHDSKSAHSGHGVGNITTSNNKKKNPQIM